MYLRSLIGLLLVGFPPSVWGEPHDAQIQPISGSFVYCHKQKVHGLEVFAGAPTKTGALRFGLTVWDSRGFNLGLWGIAIRSSDGWEYRDNMDAADPVARCDLLLRRAADNSFTLTSVGNAVCGGMNYGGAGMDIERLRFDPSNYEGPVTWQLDDADTFGNHAGRCSGG